MLSLLIVAAAGYLAGSFPTSIIVGKLFFGRDPRNEGSGNAGGTNTFRIFGWKAGIVVVIVDVGKGALAAALISRLGAGSGLPPVALQLIAGAAAVAGHVWTVFAGFRGGKGVGTAAGAIFVAAPLPAAIAALVFAAVLLATGIVSLSSLCAAAVFPLAALAIRLSGGDVSTILLVFAFLLSPLIFFTHRSNIGRLMRGEEKRFEKLMIFKRLALRISRRASDS